MNYQNRSGDETSALSGPGGELISYLDPKWSGDEFRQAGHGISSSQRFEGNSKAYTVFFLHRGTETGTQPVQGMVPRGRDRQQMKNACGCGSPNSYAGMAYARLWESSKHGGLRRGVILWLLVIP